MIRRVCAILVLLASSLNAAWYGGTHDFAVSNAVVLVATATNPASPVTLLQLQQSGVGVGGGTLQITNMFAPSSGGLVFVNPGSTNVQVGQTINFPVWFNSYTYFTNNEIVTVRLGTNYDYSVTYNYSTNTISGTSTSYVQNTYVTNLILTVINQKLNVSNATEVLLPGGLVYTNGQWYCGTFACGGGGGGTTNRWYLNGASGQTNDSFNIVTGGLLTATLDTSGGAARLQLGTSSAIFTNGGSTITINGTSFTPQNGSNYIFSIVSGDGLLSNDVRGIIADNVDTNRVKMATTNSASSVSGLTLTTAGGIVTLGGSIPPSGDGLTSNAVNSIVSGTNDTTLGRVSSLEGRTTTWNTVTSKLATNGNIDAAQVASGTLPGARLTTTSNAVGSVLVVDGNYTRSWTNPATLNVGTATTALGGWPTTWDASAITSGTLSSNRLPTTGVSAGSYGSATQVGQFTVDALGRLTSAGNVAITAAGLGVTNGVATVASTGATNSGAQYLIIGSGLTHTISGATSTVAVATAAKWVTASGGWAVDRTGSIANSNNVAVFGYNSRTASGSDMGIQWVTSQTVSQSVYLTRFLGMPASSSAWGSSTALTFQATTTNTVPIRFTSPTYVQFTTNLAATLSKTLVAILTNNLGAFTAGNATNGWVMEVDATAIGGKTNIIMEPIHWSVIAPQ